MSREKIVIVSGYFDPLHIGHLEYFRLAKELGDKLVVIVNNDKQCELKKGESFMNERDRLEIVFELGMVDEVFLSCDEDSSVCKSIEKVIQFHEESYPGGVTLPYDFVFCNGGDRHLEEIPETKICNELEIDMVDGLGEKIRSSSELTGIKAMSRLHETEYYNND